MLTFRRPLWQAAKRVFVTTRDEYPRCQLNITASVHSGYLKVNPQFIEEVKLVTSKQIEDYKQLKEKVKRLKEAVQETLFETPLQTILKEYAKDDVAKEILGNMHKKYEDWLREWEVQKKEGEAQQKSKVTGGADEAGSSPPLAAALPTAVVTRSDSRDERFTEGASSVSAGAGATPRAESSSSGSAEAMKESAESVPAGQAAEQKSAPLEGIDPGPSALPAGRRPGKEEASLEGPKDESSTLDTEARGATQAGKEVLNASKSKREGPIFNGGGGIGSVPTASVPEHGETLAVEGKGRLARMLSGMLSFGRGSSSPKAETGDMRGKSGIGAVGVVEGTLPVGEGVGPENQEQKTEQKKTEPETPPDKRLLLTYDFLRLALERLREAQEQLKPEREKIVVAMQDIIVRFGAVWIERVRRRALGISTYDGTEVRTRRGLEKGGSDTLRTAMLALRPVRPDGFYQIKRRRMFCIKEETGSVFLTIRDGLGALYRIQNAPHRLHQRLQ